MMERLKCGLGIGGGGVNQSGRRGESGQGQDGRADRIQETSNWINQFDV